MLPGWNQHDDGNHGASVKVRYASNHSVVQGRSYHIVPSSHRRRDTKISKAHEKCLNKCAG